MIRVAFWLVIVAAPLGFADLTDAVVVTFTDETTFLTATGATDATGPCPTWASSAPARSRSAT